MSELSGFEVRLKTLVRQRSAAPVALILYHGGTCHFVTQGSDAATELLDDGAVHIGLVSFDRNRPAPTSRNRLVEVGVDEVGAAWGSGRN